MLGDKTATILMTMFQDAYRQEIGAEEDVHRTLPFFATALGLIVAAINYAAGQLPNWPLLAQSCPRGQGNFWNHHMLACDWPVLLTAFLFGVASLLGISVLAFLGLATKRRGYERAGPESRHVMRARALQAWHQGNGLKDEALDIAVAQDLRQQLLDDLAKIVPINRELTLQRYAFRARAVSLLLWSLLVVLVATISAIISAKTSLVIKMTS